MKYTTVFLSFLIASAAGVTPQHVTQSISSDIHTNVDLVSDYAHDEFESDYSLEPHRSLQVTQNLTTREESWRLEHNMMRDKYQVYYGGAFVPVKWNIDLENEALVWAKEIAKTCVNKRPGKGQNVNDYGVNSVVKTNTRTLQSPEGIMKVWENKLRLGYPGNQVMTQVLWTATTYIGCADATSSVESLKACAVSVCYYAKAGNAGMISNNKVVREWKNEIIKGPGVGSCPPNIKEC